jgi:hypothetical protein
MQSSSDMFFFRTVFVVLNFTVIVSPPPKKNLYCHSVIQYQNHVEHHVKKHRTEQKILQPLSTLYYRVNQKAIRCNIKAVSYEAKTAWPGAARQLQRPGACWKVAAAMHGGVALDGDLCKSVLGLIQVKPRT